MCRRLGIFAIIRPDFAVFTVVVFFTCRFRRDRRWRACLFLRCGCCLGMWGPFLCLWICLFLRSLCWIFFVWVCSRRWRVRGNARIRRCIWIGGGIGWWRVGSLWGRRLPLFLLLLCRLLHFIFLLYRCLLIGIQRILNLGFLVVPVLLIPFLIFL